jgi:hypothetical protein
VSDVTFWRKQKGGRSRPPRWCDGASGVAGAPSRLRACILCAPLALIRGAPAPGTGAEAARDHALAVDVRDHVAVCAEQCFGGASSPSRELPGGIGLRHGRRS